MLYLHQSNQLEVLASSLATIHANAPLSGAFAAENIVVQSQGMRRYLNRFLAEKNGIAANLQFSLPAGFSWRLMQKVMPNLSALNPFSPQVLQWRLMKTLSHPDFQAQHPMAWEQLQPYLSSNPNALYDLSGQLADIFDQYLVYRPHWLDAWQQGNLLDLGKDEAWQQALWLSLANSSHQETPHRAQLWQNLLTGLNENHLPERISIFGVAAMAPMYLELFQTIAKHIDVHIFALNPCQDYWYQLQEPEQILHNNDDENLNTNIHQLIGHPLLASLGKQGRDFLNSLTSEANLAYSAELFQQPEQKSLLRQLQSDILTLQSPQASEASLASLHDGSIMIHGAHSPLRELQILKDQLLSLLEKNPDWQAHDIAVLTPKIEPYTPFIEAIFGEHAPDGVSLPYSVADVKISQKQPFLSGIESLLELLQSRFEIKQAFPLLDNPCVLNRFELTLDDVPCILDALENLNIRWGLDENMRQRFGGKSNHFTWSQGLERLALGLVLPSEGHLSETWQHTAPLSTPLEQLPIYTQWLQLWDTLNHYYRLFQQPTTVEQWAERLQQLSLDCLLPAETDTAASANWSKALADWVSEAKCAQLTEELPFNVVAKHVNQFLSSSSEAGFLRQGITFCSMIPMRSLPFKVICLLGLNDGSYPRNFSKPEFDLINQHPAKGDRSHRDDDRYLFLESIISARETLYLSFLGKSQDKNDDMAASPLLHELIDVVASMTGQGTTSLWASWVKQHPLQAFSKRYYQENSDIYSYRTDYAAALNQPIKNNPEFLIQPLAIRNEKFHLNIQSFIQFWKNPVRYWLKNQLGWNNQYLQGTLEETEPFVVENATTVYDALYEAKRQHLNFEKVSQHLAAKNIWPDGYLAEHWQRYYVSEIKNLPQAWFNNQHLPPQTIQYQYEDITLVGSLKSLYSNGLMFYQDKKMNSTDKVEILLEHLITCACYQPTKGLIIWPPEPQELAPIEQKTAQKILNECLNLWKIGQSQPLPFFARTSLGAAKEWGECIQKNIDPKEPENFAKILSTARGLLEGNKMSIGQKDYEEVALVFGEKDSDSLVNLPLFQYAIEHIWQPLYECMKPVEHDELEKEMP